MIVNWFDVVGLVFVVLYGVVMVVVDYWLFDGCDSFDVVFVVEIDCFLFDFVVFVGFMCIFMFVFVR